MSLLSKVRRAKLPELPHTFDEHLRAHTDWLQHLRQIEDLRTAATGTEQEIARLERERGELAASLADDQVAELIEPDAAAAAERVRARKAQLAGIDEGLDAARERRAIQQEAARRVRDREPALRDRIAGELRTQIEATYRALMTQLAGVLEEFVPVNQQMLELLRRYHGQPGGEILAGAVAFDELRLVPSAAPPNKLTIWVRRAKALAIAVTLDV